MRPRSTASPHALGLLIVRLVLCVIVLLRIGSPVPEYAAFGAVAQFDFGPSDRPGDSEEDASDESEQVLNGKVRRPIQSDEVIASHLATQLPCLTPVPSTSPSQPITCPSAPSRTPAIIPLRI